MALTNAQKTALKTQALLDATASTYINNGDDISLAAWFNQLTTTDAWRQNMPWTDFFENMDGAEYQARSQGERDYLRELRESGPINMARGKIRTAIKAAFSGSVARTVATRNALWTAGTEKATRAEVILGGTNATEDAVTALRRSEILSSNGVGTITYSIASDIRTV